MSSRRRRIKTEGETAEKPAQKKIKAEPGLEMEPKHAKYEKVEATTKFEFKKVKIETDSPYADYNRPSPLECNIAMSAFQDLSSL